VDEEQTVILHFHGMTYGTSEWSVDFAAQANQITLWGQTGLVYAVTVPGRPVDVGFLLKIRTNTRYTLRESDFTFPSGSVTGMCVPAYNWSNPQTTYSFVDSFHILMAGSVANDLIELVSDPKTNLGISAKSAWPDQEAATRTATIMVKVTPPEDADKLKDRITLEVKELQGNPSYTPTGMGTLTQDSSNKLRWRYEAFEEPQSAKHPEYKSAVIVAKLDGKDEVATLKLRVQPVFKYLVSKAAAPLNPGQAGAGAQRTPAYHYVRWKYGGSSCIDGAGPGFSGGVTIADTLTTACGSNPNADACTDLNTDHVTFGLIVFSPNSDENTAASTIGHELVHTGQTTLGCLFYNCECPAYEWELDHTNCTSANANNICFELQGAGCTDSRCP
jgi:hypothetical protein